MKKNRSSYLHAVSICPKCGENRKAWKGMCGKCGYIFTTKCPKCGKKINMFTECDCEQ